MTDGWIRGLVEAIHSSPTQAVLYLSGGASQALGWLMSVPGASNTVLEAVVPYSRNSMIQLLSKIPAHFASQQTVEEMALLAYNRALKLSRPGFPVVGVGFTGSLASVPPKHGDHRFYLSTRTSDRLCVSKITLSKGLRTREQEDKVSSHFLVKAIADACKVSASFVSELNDSEMPEEHEKLFNEDQGLQQLINGEICMKVYPFSSETHTSKLERKIILSGSFNPLHDGHVKLLEVATRRVFIGDVIVVKDPENPDKYLVRRLAATEGYEMVSTDEKDEPFVLEKDQCWVLSDNESLKPKEAKDSRTFGPVPTTDIVGRVIYCLRTAVDHGPVQNSRFSMERDSPVIAVELDVDEMAKNHKA